MENPALETLSPAELTNRALVGLLCLRREVTDLPEVDVVTRRKLESSLESLRATLVELKRRDGVRRAT